MLQFWIPRTEKFENAILGNFRLPFLFREVDVNSEKISMEILRAMSQYEDNEKFNSELVTEILTNKALRQKIKVNNTIEENAVLIKEELFKKYETTKMQLSKETQKKESLSGELDLVKNEIGALTKKIDEFRVETNNKIVKEFDLIRKSKVQEIKSLQDSLKAKKDQLKRRINDFDEQINKAEIEFNQSSKTIMSIVKSTFIGKTKYLKDLQIQIQNKYYNSSKYNEVKKEFDITTKELEELNVPEVNEKIIIYCENQNSIFFNNLNFENIHFIAENNSNSVFIKVVANQIHFGVRDRDYLTDNEIVKIQNSYSNYIILEYYCFENYLFHPNNIEELNKKEFNKELYIAELIKQKNSKYDSILIKLKNARNGYQEFKVPDNKFRENDEVICKYLKSDEIEEFLKSFSLKTEFDKTIISKLQLKQEELSSTDWFRKKMENLLSFG